MCILQTLSSPGPRWSWPAPTPCPRVSTLTPSSGISTTRSATASSLVWLRYPRPPYWSACLMLSSDWSQDRVLTFPPGGACISLPQSGILRPGTHRLVINNASQLCSGKYICQVTESRPPFKTEQAAAVLQVLGEAENNFALKILHLSRFTECITKKIGLANNDCHIKFYFVNGSWQVERERETFNRKEKEFIYM